MAGRRSIITYQILGSGGSNCARDRCRPESDLAALQSALASPIPSCQAAGPRMI